MKMTLQRTIFIMAVTALAGITSAQGVPAPENVQIQNITTNSVIVSYQLSNKTEAYTKIQVILVNRESNESFQFSTKAIVPMAKFQLKDLESGTQYKVKLASMSPDNRTSEMKEKDFLTAGPKRVKQAVVDHLTDTTAQISWQANKNPVDSYEIKITNNAGQSSIQKVLGNITTITLMDLSPDTKYMVEIFAVKNSIKGMESETINFHTEQQVLVTKEPKTNTTTKSSTKPFTGVTPQPDCPDICKEKGVMYGNIAHPTNPKRFIQCSFGKSFGCNNCAPGTYFIAGDGKTTGGYCA